MRSALSAVCGYEASDYGVSHSGVKGFQLVSCFEMLNLLGGAICQHYQYCPMQAV